MRSFQLAVAAFVLGCFASAAFSQERLFTPAPLLLLEEQVDKNTENIDSLKSRVDRLEASVMSQESSLVDLISEVKSLPQKLAAPSPAPVKSAEPILQHPVVHQPSEPVSNRKSANEILQELRSKYRGQVYATMARGQEDRVWDHLVQHGYTRDQISSLSQSDATALHSLSHSEGPDKITPFRSQAIAQAQAPVQAYVSVPQTYSMPIASMAFDGGFDPNCANGQCARQSYVRAQGNSGGASSMVQVSGGGSGIIRASVNTGGGWYPGKLLFGRR